MKKLYVPRAYQGLIRNHMIDTQRSGIFAGMGLGKTVATLTGIDEMKLAGMLNGPALVVAPLRVAKTTWPDEAQKWEHLREIAVSPIVGSVSQRMKALKFDASVYTINYENIPWLVDLFGDKWPFEMVIADESTRLKGFRLQQGTQRSKALGRVAHTKVKHWVNLTGTPTPNGVQDLWGQTWFLDAGKRLGRTHTGFKDRWFQKDYTGYGTIPLDHATDQITAAISDICISINPKDYFDLKDPIVNIIEVELPEDAREQYKAMEKDFFMQIEGHEVEAFNTAAQSMKLLQLCSGAVYLDKTKTNWKEVHDEKLQALESVINDAAGMPVLVAYHFSSDLERLQRAFPRGRVLDSKSSTIHEWNAGKIPLLFAHPQSAGHGLNLQEGGNILVFFSHWWDLEYYEQILERIGPMRQLQSGLDRPVFVHLIVAKDTMDEVVIERRDGKKTVQELVMQRLKQSGLTI